MASLIIPSLMMIVLAIILTPREWMRNRILAGFVMLFHALGVASMVLLLFFVYKMSDGFYREAIIWTMTVYFAFLEFTLILVIVRYCMHEIARHFDKKRILKIINNGAVFYLISMMITGLYLIPATHNATNLKATEYNISVNKSAQNGELTIVSCSDLHVGGGARHREIDQMLAYINAAHPDVVVIVGDVCDSSSSVNDLEYLKSALNQIDSRYGIYYCQGNHEDECREEWIPYMKEAGVIFLNDRGIELQKGINLIGRANELQMTVPEIIKKDNLDVNDVNIVIQHRPKELKEQDGISDLVICGHTHGYQFPFHSIYTPYTRDMAYGHQKFGLTDVVVTSGVSEWGYRSKWPSQSEVAIVNLKIAGIQ